MEVKAIEFINDLASQPGNEDVNSIWYCIAVGTFALTRLF